MAPCTSHDSLAAVLSEGLRPAKSVAEIGMNLPDLASNSLFLRLGQLVLGWQLEPL